MAATKDITKADYERLADFRYTLRKFLRFSEEAATAEGVAAQQHQAMLVIKGFPGRDRITIGELADRLQIKPHSAVGLANRLVAENYARRSTDIEDHRQVYLQLTRHGEDVLKKLSTAHQAELRRLGPQLSRLLAALREEKPGAGPL